MKSSNPNLSSSHQLNQSVKQTFDLLASEIVQANTTGDHGAAGDRYMTHTSLTEPTLETHNQETNKIDWAKAEEERVARVQQAARELGFELKPDCIARDKWDMQSWLNAERKKQFRDK